MKFLTLLRNQIHRRAILLWLTGICCALPATSAAPLREQVVSIESTGLKLAHTGSAAFADIIFPDATLAESWLLQHLLQQELAFVPQGEDRYGRTLIRSEVEAAMLREGVALAYGSKSIPNDMLQAEAAARLAHRGVWASTALFATPENAAGHLQQFTVVEGTITHLYKGRRGTYLNFGDDWRSDFSVGITKRYLRSFTQLEKLREGSRVRVRGVVMQENGPMIQLTRPEQLEIL